MTRPILITAASVMLAHLGVAAPAATIHCVHDEGLNDSQFCIGPYLPFPSIGIIPVGPLYQNCDIEALDLDWASGDLFINLYAASGDDTPRPGHLYLVNKSVGIPLWDFGDIWEVDSTGAPVKNITEIDAISFHPTTGALWGWGQHTGLFVIPSPPSPSSITPGMEIDPQIGCVTNEPQVEIIGATVVFPTTEVEIEDLTWNFEGTVLYAVENLHNDPVDSHGDHEERWGQPDFDFDFDEGIRLWASDGTNLVEMCPNLAPQIAAAFKDLYGQEIPAEIEALEALPEGLIPGIIPSLNDLLLVGFHGPDTLLYAVILTPQLPLTTPLGCELLWIGEIPSALNDIEGLAFDLFDP